MSSTRTATPGGPLHQNRYSSDPLYTEERGVNGTAVSARASLLLAPVKRSLIYFLQSLSLERDWGGLKRVASEILEMFPERLGSPTMHLVKKRPGKHYSLEEAQRIDAELRNQVELLDVQEFYNRFDDVERSPAVLLEQCRDAAKKKLSEFLLQLCVNPRLEIRVPGDEALVESEREEAIESRAVGSQFEMKPATVPYFQDIVGALLEYQRSYSARVLKRFVHTSISRQIFAVLDRARSTGKWALIRGDAGFGKTESLKAWFDAHRGEARFATQEGINHRTAFFRSIAKPCGLPHTAGLSASKVQARVEDFLERSGLMLIIDEAQYLFPGQKRVYSHPELVNWLMTACFNQNVPVVLSATTEFDRRRRAVEAQTTWSAEQLIRRIKRAIELPAAPTKADLVAVASSRLPGIAKPTIYYIVGYAMRSKRFFDGIDEVIEDALWVAEESGRQELTFSDVEKAVQIYRELSDASLKRACTDKPPKLSKQSHSGHESALQSGFQDSEPPAHDEHFAGSRLAGNALPATRGTAVKGALQPVS